MEKNTFHKYLSEFQFILFIPSCQLNYFFSVRTLQYISSTLIRVVILPRVLLVVCRLSLVLIVT